ncbi:hypothetical protein ABZV91_26405 [Nocardia sp. NPDC004568]
MGTAARIRRTLTRLGDVGVTEFMAVPFGTPAEQDRTVELRAEPAGGIR